MGVNWTKTEVEKLVQKTRKKKKQVIWLKHSGVTEYKQGWRGKEQISQHLVNHVEVFRIYAKISGKTSKAKNMT